jgi:hypothetical protein
VPLAAPPQKTKDALAKGIVDAATFPYEGAASFDIGTDAKNTLKPGISSASFYRGILPFLIAPLILIVLLFVFP